MVVGVSDRFVHEHLLNSHNNLNAFDLNLFGLIFQRVAMESDTTRSQSCMKQGLRGEFRVYTGQYSIPERAATGNVVMSLLSKMNSSQATSCDTLESQKTCEHK
jgi:hypothetical protein